MAGGFPFSRLSRMYMTLPISLLLISRFPAAPPPASLEVFHRRAVGVQPGLAAARLDHRLHEGGAVVRQDAPGPLLGHQLAQLEVGVRLLGDRDQPAPQLLLVVLLEVTAVA